MPLKTKNQRRAPFSRPNTEENTMKITKFVRTRVAAMILAAALMLMTAVPALAETFSAIVTASEMTVYSDAKLSAAQGMLDHGEVVRVTAYTGKAARIEYDGKTGYAKVDDMKAVDAVGTKAVTNTTTRVYATPSESAKSASLSSGTRLYVLSWTSDWAQVERDGNVGFVKLTALTRTDDDWNVPTPTPDPTPKPAAGQKGIVSADSMTVYKKADTGSKKLGTLQKGQEVNVLNHNSKWAYIELNGKKGYCLVKSLSKPTADPTPTPTPAPTVKVTDDKLAVYEEASTLSKQLGTLKKGQVVSLISQADGWAYIELGGNMGYCDASGLNGGGFDVPDDVDLEDAARGRVNASGLTVYKTASTGAKKLITLNKGNIVNVIKWNDKWAYIEYNGTWGFCDVTGLTPTDEKPTPTPTATPSHNSAVKYTVIEENVTVYNKADMTSTALGSLMWGDTVYVLAIEGDWAYIEKGGKYGFCLAEALSKQASDLDETPSGYKKANFDATVIHPDAVAYEAESTKGASTPLSLGSNVRITAYSTSLEWATIEIGEDRMFVPIKYLSRANYDTVDSTGSEMQTLLKALLTYGYYDGIPSSSPDSALATAAIKRFQAACGMKETGTADAATQRVLYAGYAPRSSILSTAMSNGDKGDNVTRLQLRLYALGYLSKSASLDGDYGSITASAVTLFQKANDISATGTADTSTLKAIYSPNAEGKPSSVKAADAASSSSSSGGGSVVDPSGTVKLSSTYVTTMPAALKSNTNSFSDSMSAAQKLEYVIYVAQSNLGKPYVYGATGTSSFDCSGLTQYCFKKAGVSLKRTAYSQGYDSTYTKISSVSGLKRGDLIFFNTISDSDLCDHVGIYLGGNCFIHASSGGHKVVVSSVASGYYNRVFSWGRRVLK